MSFDPRLYKRVTARNPVVKPLSLCSPQHKMWWEVDRTIRGRMWGWLKKGKEEVEYKVPMTYQLSVRVPRRSRVVKGYRVQGGRLVQGWAKGGPWRGRAGLRGRSRAGVLTWAWMRSRV